MFVSCLKCNSVTPHDDRGFCSICNFENLPDFKEGWFHDCSVGVAGDIFYASTEDESSDSQWYGPFKTFGEAKKDAIAFHKADLDNARRAIQDLRKLRKSDTSGNR